jgi:hypothetical protein
MDGRLFVAWRRRRDRILSIHPFASDSELELTGRMGEDRNHVFNIKGIVFIDPLFEKSVRDLQLNVFPFPGEKVNGFNPNVEILLTDPFL